MASLISETTQKIFTPETLRAGAKPSERCHVVPVRLRRAIKNYLREQEDPHMRRKVLRLSKSFNEIKDVNLHLVAETSKELVEDPLKSMEQSKRWKIKSAYGDIGLTYRDDETVAYVASRMPAVYSACHRVLSEVRKRLPGFLPTKVLNFGAGTGSAFWAMREVWPKSVEKINIMEPSPSMQRAGRSLIQDMELLQVSIESYVSFQALTKEISQSEREHDLVIASYVLGEIPSLNDRITIVRQLLNLTQDVLVLVEPGTPHGSNIISQMDVLSPHAYMIPCYDFLEMPKKPSALMMDVVHWRNLQNTVFVHRLQRTTSQRAYKKRTTTSVQASSNIRESWPLDGMKFETLKEQRSKRNPEDVEFDYEDLVNIEETADIIPYEEALGKECNKNNLMIKDVKLCYYN
ncbi:hypothetical protein CRYUN_Cryun12cG0062400 [Craigia yunnanensis]